MKFYEKGDRPLEIVTSRQWFIRTMDHKEPLLARGREMRWHPEYMQHRYENWVNGLTGDWCVSRQRFFGVPFPVWYAVRADGTTDYSRQLVPDESRLPVDPSTDVPDGYAGEPARRARRLHRRSGRHGHVGDVVADAADRRRLAGRSRRCSPGCSRWTCGRRRTTSSGRGCSPRCCGQSSSTASLPWTNAAISGWVLDPDRKKMSKSKGNVVTPMALLEEHGSDGVRYWAASGRPGTDTAFDPAQMKVGRRLAIKLLNAARFALLQAEPRGAVVEPLDRGMLTQLSRLVEDATEHLEAYDYTRVLERTEAFFWTFCDDYLELVKSRRYGDFGPEGAASANSAMLVALSTLLRLFAPYPAVRDRGSVVVVAARIGAPRVVADARGSGRGDWRPRRPVRRRCSPPRRRPWPTCGG